MEYSRHLARIYWLFDYESTTSLFDTPVKSIAPDLTALAGAEALLERAEHYLERHDPLTAIHLIEIILNSEALNTKALTAMLQAHQLLLEQSNHQNIHEALWLNAEISNLEERLRHAQQWEDHSKSKELIG